MKQIKQKLKWIIEDESAQGATEYILLIVAVVAALALFKEPLTTMVQEKMNAVKTSVLGFE